MKDLVRRNIGHVWFTRILTLEVLFEVFALYTLISTSRTSIHKT